MLLDLNGRGTVLADFRFEETPICLMQEIVSLHMELPCISIASRISLTWARILLYFKWESLRYYMRIVA